MTFVIQFFLLAKIKSSLIYCEMKDGQGHQRQDKYVEERKDRARERRGGEIQPKQHQTK